MARKTVATNSLKSVRKQRQRVMYLAAGVVAFILLLSGVGLTWLMASNQSTENRSQAAVSYTYAMNMEPVIVAGRVQGFDVVVNAQSDIAVPTAVGARVALIPGLAGEKRQQVSLPPVPAGAAPRAGAATPVPVQASPVTAPTGHRVLLENSSWIVSTPLDSSVQFAPLSFEPHTAKVGDREIPAAQVRFSARANGGSTALQGKYVVVRFTSRSAIYAQDGWANHFRLLEPSIMGYLLSAPGAELDLLRQKLDATKGSPQPVACPATVLKCPIGSTAKTSPEYPCGACIDDATGRLTGPQLPSPKPKTTNDRRTQPQVGWGIPGRRQ